MVQVNEYQERNTFKHLYLPYTHAPAQSFHTTHMNRFDKSAQFILILKKKLETKCVCVFMKLCFLYFLHTVTLITCHFYIWDHPNNLFIISILNYNNSPKKLKVWVRNQYLHYFSWWEKRTKRLVIFCLLLQAYRISDPLFIQQEIRTIFEFFTSLPILNTF